MYELGVISRNDLMSIAYYSNFSSRENNEDIIPKDFVPQTITPAVLSEETQEKIKQSYYAIAPAEGLTADDIYIYDYYGTYNGCPVVVMHYSSLGYVGAIGEKIIDGISLFINSGDTIYIYKQNTSNK
jgi:hypothetical protein